ncbi:hypothetical protein PFISCL1PPCAC_15281, partial [Pristionchus fissidentatus]
PMVASISRSQLAAIISEWHCSRSDCTHFKKGVGFQVSGVPLVLTCGHYICSVCRDSIHESEDVKLFCQYEISEGEKCGADFYQLEMKDLPVAHHIRTFTEHLIDRGVHCDLESDETINGNTKQVGFYPAQLMRTCKHEDCNQNKKVTLFPPSSFYAESTATNLCLLCSKDHNHTDLVPFPLNSITRSISTKRLSWKNFSKDRHPWHISFPSRSVMRLFVKFRTYCQMCTNTKYTASNYPVILDCGHCCCKECEEESLTPGWECCETGCDGAHAPTEPGLGRKAVDLQMILNMDEDLFSLCNGCGDKHSIDNMFQREGLCIFCLDEFQRRERIT